MFFPKETARKQIEQWVKDYSRELYAYCFVRLRNHEEAEDLVQLTFIKAFRSYESFRKGSSDKAWLYSILLNNIKDHLKKTKQYSQLLSFDGDEELKNLLIDDKPSPDVVAEDFLEREILAQGIAALPEHFAVPFLLREVSDLSYKQIAELLDVPIGTIMSRLSRARKTLYELFASKERLAEDAKKIRQNNSTDASIGDKHDAM